jgi:hypothetical protein
MPRTGAPYFILAAVAGGLLLIVLGLYLTDRVAELPGQATAEARRALQEIAAAFKTGRITVEFKDYVTEVRGVNRLQVAQLQSVDSFSRTDSTAIFWDALQLPDVRVRMEMPVEYSYYLDLNEPWTFAWREAEQAIVVDAPALRCATPAVDLAGMRVEVLEGSVLRDEAAVQERLKSQMPELLRRAAEQKIPLVRETARRQTRLFVENWFVKVRFQDAPVKPHVLDVAFADETAAPPLRPEK